MLMEDFRFSNSSPSVLIVKEGRKDYDSGTYLVDMYLWHAGTKHLLLVPCPSL
jgi:hypothetical protein